MRRGGRVCVLKERGRVWEVMEGREDNGGRPVHQLGPVRLMRRSDAPLSKVMYLHMC